MDSSLSVDDDLIVSQCILALGCSLYLMTESVRAVYQYCHSRNPCIYLSVSSLSLSLASALLGAVVCRRAYFVFFFSTSRFPSDRPILFRRLLLVVRLGEVCERETADE